MQTLHRDLQLFQFVVDQLSSYESISKHANTLLPAHSSTCCICAVCPSATRAHRRAEDLTFNRHFIVVIIIILHLHRCLQTQQWNNKSLIIIAVGELTLQRNTAQSFLFSLTFRLGAEIILRRCNGFYGPEAREPPSRPQRGQQQQQPHQCVCFKTTAHDRWPAT